jgi:hypothetical protein
MTATAATTQAIAGCSTPSTTSPTATDNFRMVVVFSHGCCNDLMDIVWIWQWWRSRNGQRRKFLCIQLVVGLGKVLRPNCDLLRGNDTIGWCQGQIQLEREHVAALSIELRCLVAPVPQSVHHDADLIITSVAQGHSFLATGALAQPVEKTLHLNGPHVPGHR